MIRMCEKYPDLRFRHCGDLWQEGVHPANAGSYFGYIGMAQYLNGVVAGHTSKSKKLGFVAAKPIPQVLLNVNSFTLSARSVDPTITTQVIFTGEWSLAVKEAEAKADMIKAEITKGGYSVIKGPLNDNTDKEVVAAGTAYEETAIELESMDYLVEGVVGSTS